MKCNFVKLHWLLVEAFPLVVNAFEIMVLMVLLWSICFAVRLLQVFFSILLLLV